MKRVLPAALLAAALLAAATAADGASDGARQYVVLYEKGASVADARAAIKDAGGKIIDENRAIGLATVRTDDGSFATDVARSGAIEGAAADMVIGRVPKTERRKDDVERLEAARRAARKEGTAKHGGARGDQSATGDPLSPLQWDMQMIGATPEGSYAREQGKGVRVGIIDTGVDGSHPDIAPNFDRKLSRNFTTDRPEIDGPCSDEPDNSCQDPADVDEDGHGTHVAGTIASPLNGQGIGGVAPRATIVNLRGGQDSGYFFIGPVVDALTYAGDHGIDVVNMSFYIDPWLYNCTANPADTPTQQLEQQMIIEATQRALDYARQRGVTLIAAEGNGHTDLGKPVSDTTSPDYPLDTEHDRTIDNGTCFSMPTEANGVIGVTSVGPSKRKAYYSDYGLEQADLSAPGGDFRDNYGTPDYANPTTNLILAPYPKAVAIANGDVDENGVPTSNFVVEDHGSYYQYLQGTSMAAPHAVGVAALAIGQYGWRDSSGKTLTPAITEAVMRDGATDTACPAQNPFVYPGLSPIYTATCEGTPDLNGFY
ncbi:MAG TPA: S8 family serine peptidase, partial [Solirubrobacteraceae bacterium]|nr:S8 family serine peptidase [Solirubrobacteraceae bacterium]